jgi:hypothetical protein
METNLAKQATKTRTIETQVILETFLEWLFSIMETNLAKQATKARTIETQVIFETFFE